MAVGQAISMVDSHLRVSGSIDYTLNFELPRMLHACVLRSPHAHARVVKVDASRAAKLPGVIGVLTRDDLIGDHIDPYFGLILQDQTPVALDRVRFVGEPVAAVFAAEPYTAEDIAELVVPTIEPLTPCLDPVASPREFAPGRNTEAAVSPKPTAISTLPLPERMRW